LAAATKTPCAVRSSPETNTKRVAPGATGADAVTDVVVTVTSTVGTGACASATAVPAPRIAVVAAAAFNTRISAPPVVPGTRRARIVGRGLHPGQAGMFVF
jgi:hypothetical protein